MAPSSKGGEGKGVKQRSGMLARGLDPLGPNKSSAAGRTLGIFWHTQLLSQIPHRGSIFFGKKVFPSTSPVTCSWRMKNSYVALDKAPFSMETRGLDTFFPVCHPSPHTVFRFFPLVNRRCGMGRAAKQSSIP